MAPFRHGRLGSPAGISGPNSVSRSGCRSANERGSTNAFCSWSTDRKSAPGEVDRQFSRSRCCLPRSYWIPNPCLARTGIATRRDNDGKLLPLGSWNYRSGTRQCWPNPLQEMCALLASSANGWREQSASRLVRPLRERSGGEQKPCRTRDYRMTSRQSVIVMSSGVETCLIRSGGSLNCRGDWVSRPYLRSARNDRGSG